MMRIDIATLFPDMCEQVLAESIIGRAEKKGQWRPIVTRSATIP